MMHHQGTLCCKTPLVPTESHIPRSKRPLGFPCCPRFQDCYSNRHHRKPIASPGDQPSAHIRPPANGLTSPTRAPSTCGHTPGKGSAKMKSAPLSSPLAERGDMGCPSAAAAAAVPLDLLFLLNLNQWILARSLSQKCSHQQHSPKTMAAKKHMKPTRMTGQKRAGRRTTRQFLT